MPRPSIVPSAFDEPKPMANDHHKTERSHEENQERAYIAASRRSDRCIEARVQSARMASEIHKKRTGRGFKITKEIVLNEEMYEEENDNLPRSHRLLRANLQMPSPDMNTSMEADPSNKIEISKMLARANEEWRENEINRLFARSFPNAMPSAQQKAQMIPNAAISRHSVEEHSPTVYAPISYPSATLFNTPATASHISASTIHRRQTIRNRRWSCTSSSPMSSSRENSAKAASRLPNSPSPETTSTTTTTPSIECSLSPNIPVDSTFCIPTLVNLDTFEPQVLSNSPMLHEPSGMPGITQMSQEVSGSVPDQYGHAADEINVCKSPMPSIPDDDPWHAFINDAIWPSGSQH